MAAHLDRLVQPADRPVLQACDRQLVSVPHLWRAAGQRYGAHREPQRLRLDHFRDWEPVGGDERDYEVADPRDPDIVYSSGLGGRLSRWDARNGEVQNVSPWPISSYGQRPTDFQQRYSWITPIAISQIDPYPMYLRLAAPLAFDRPGHELGIDGTRPVGTSPAARDCNGDLDPTRARACGYGVIWSIGLSTRDNSEIWVGTDDGLVRLTRDGGKSWGDVTPKGLPAWAKI